MSQALVMQAAVTAVVALAVGGSIAFLAAATVVRRISASEDHFAGVEARQQKWVRDHLDKLAEDAVAQLKEDGARLHRETQGVLEVPFSRDAYTGEAPYPAPRDDTSPAGGTRRTPTGRLPAPWAAPAPPAAASFPPLAGTGPEARHREPTLPPYPPAPGSDRIDRTPSRRARHGL